MKNTATCPDCGMEYSCSSEDHNLLCDARTCVMCFNTWPNVIALDDNGERVCRECRKDLDRGEFDRDSEEEEEPDGAA